MTIQLGASLPTASVAVALGHGRENDAVGANITRDQATDAFLESFVKRGPIDRLLEQPGQLDRFVAPE